MLGYGDRNSVHLETKLIHVLYSLCMKLSTHQGPTSCEGRCVEPVSLPLGATKDSNLRPLDCQARFLPTRPQCHPHGLGNHFMVIFKWPLKRLPNQWAWSSYTCWSSSVCCHVTRCIQQPFCWNFHIKDGNDLSQFSQTEVKETQGSVIICHRQITCPHQNCTKCNLSGLHSLNWNVRMVACHQWGDSLVWEQLTPLIRHSWNYNILCCDTRASVTS